MIKGCEDSGRCHQGVTARSFRQASPALGSRPAAREMLRLNDVADGMRSSWCEGGLQWTLHTQTRGPDRWWCCCTGFRSARRCGTSNLTGIGNVYRVIAPDLRGFGESPVPEGTYSMDAMADDVVELLETLEIAGPVVVGGLSMGGYVALSLVARYPTRVKALMLMDTRAGADTPEAAQGREATAKAVIAAE